MRRLGPILLGTIPLWLAGAAFAQATPDGAAALRDGLNEMLKPILGIQVQQQSLFAGLVTVEPAADGYTVVFPGIDLTLKAKEDKAKSLALRCDAQTYSAASTGAATWRLEGRQPLNCVAVPEGEGAFTLTSRALQAHVVVDLQQKLFTDGAWRADALSIIKDGSTGKIGIDILSATLQLRPIADSARRDVAFKLEVSGIGVRDKTGVDRISLGQAAYAVTMDGFDVTEAVASYSALSDAFSYMTALMVPPGQEPTDPDRIAEIKAQVSAKLIAPFKRLAAAFGHGGTFAGAITDLRINAPDLQVALGLARVAEGYAGASNPNGTGVLELEMGGLALAPKPPFAQWIPTDGTIRLDASSIPWAEVGAAYMRGLEISASPTLSPAEAQQRTVQSMMQLGAVLRRAGSRLDVTGFHIAAPDAAVDLKGSVQGKEAAAHGVNADLDLRFTNLDGLIKFIQGLPDGAQAAAGLTMAQVMGRQATADDGRPARDYDIVVDEAGRILVNGTDLAAFAPKQ